MNLNRDPLIRKIQSDTMPGEVVKNNAARRALLSAFSRVPSAQRGVMGSFEGEMAVPPASLSQLADYGVFRPDAVEVVRQPLYDRLIYPAAGSTLLQFFQLPQGQGNSSATGGAGLTKSLEDTNMEAAGQLPSPKAFLATSIELIVEGGSVSAVNTWSPQDIAFLTNVSAAAIPAPLNSLNDDARILQSGVLDFFIGSKSYLTNARADSFPPKSYIAPDAAISQAINLGITAVAAVRAVGRPFYLNPPVLLMPNTNFVVRLLWTTAIATPTTCTARITCRMDGFLYRNAQ